MTRSFRNRVPVARVVLGQSLGMAVAIYAETAADIGVPLVEVVGALEHLQHLTPEQAEQFAEGLKLAARVARGEVLPTPLDEFLSKRRA